MKKQQLKLVETIDTDDPLTVADDAIVRVGLAVPYVIARLDERHIPHILALQAEDKHKALVHRSGEWFQQHLAAGHQIFGVFQSDKDSVLARSQSLEKPAPNLAALRGMIRVSHFDVDAEPFLTQNFNVQAGLIPNAEKIKMSFVGGLMVGNDMRGGNLSSALIEHCIADAKRVGSKFENARVLVGNHCSLDKFLKRDFLVTAVGQSPDDKSRSVYFVNNPFRNEFSFDRNDTVLAKDQKIQDYLNLGYVGTAIDKHRGLITMTKIQANEL